MTVGQAKKGRRLDNRFIEANGIVIFVCTRNQVQRDEKYLSFAMFLSFQRFNETIICLLANRLSPLPRYFSLF